MNALPKEYLADLSRVLICQKMRRPPVIQPTIGRIMWFWPGTPWDGVGVQDPEQPFAAQVCFVHNDNMVNLLVTDHDGCSHRATSVPIVQDGSPYEATKQYSYAAWMPYQKAQAEKAGLVEVVFAAKANPAA